MGCQNYESVSKRFPLEKFCEVKMLLWHQNWKLGLKKILVMKKFQEMKTQRTIQMRKEKVRVTKMSLPKPNVKPNRRVKKPKMWITIQLPILYQSQLMNKLEF